MTKQACKDLHLTRRENIEVFWPEWCMWIYIIVEIYHSGGKPSISALLCTAPYQEPQPTEGPGCKLFNTVIICYSCSCVFFAGNQLSNPLCFRWKVILEGRIRWYKNKPKQNQKKVQTLASLQGLLRFKALTIYFKITCHLFRLLFVFNFLSTNI